MSSGDTFSENQHLVDSFRLVDRPGPGQLAGPACLALVSRSVTQTRRLGCLLAGLLTANSVVSLDGDLGAGKTALTQGLADGLGCLGPVASPTFTLVMEHEAGEGGLALYHFDVYRLGSAQDFLDFGLDEYFDRGGVCVLEWGRLVTAALPADTLMIELRQIGLDKPDQRQITLTWPARPDVLANLERMWLDVDACF